MTKPLKIKIDFESDTTKSLLQFISETQEGKYTSQMPYLTQVIYQRLEVQEQDKIHSVEDNNEETILFGVSY